MNDPHSAPMTSSADHHAGESRSDAFTLIEILVVISIIVLLMAMLLPSLIKAKEAGRRVQCLSNQRQVSLAAISYAQDHHGFLPQKNPKRYGPGSIPWFWHQTTMIDELSVYAPGIMLAVSCPSHQGPLYEPIDGFPWEGFYTSYGYLAGLDDPEFYLPGQWYDAEPAAVSLNLSEAEPQSLVVVDLNVYAATDEYWLMINHPTSRGFWGDTNGFWEWGTASRDDVSGALRDPIGSTPTATGSG